MRLLNILSSSVLSVWDASAIKILRGTESLLHTLKSGSTIWKSSVATVLFTMAFGVLSANAATPSKLPNGMFSTSGNQIVDQNGNSVRLSCVYWPGMNGEDGTLSNLTSPLNGYQANVNAIAAAGFDCIRVDFNNISLHDSGTSAFLSELDQVVSAAGTAGLRIIIVDHDNEGNFGSNDGGDPDCAAQQHNGLWYDSGGASDGTDGCNDPGHTTQASYQSDWVSIASRYANNNTVIGYDLWNEPLSYGLSTWGDGTNQDIHQMYQTVGSAILTEDPTKLIIAECPQNYGPTTLFDGSTYGNAPWGDCTGVKNDPVVFTVNGQQITNKVVYDVHLYPNSVSGIASLFNNSSSSTAAITAMNNSFGYLLSQNIAPVWDGEGGTGLAANPDDTNWAEMLDSYLNGGEGPSGGPTFSSSQQGMGFAWMDWGTPGSQDALGILNSDGSVNSAQMQYVSPLLYYPASGGVSPSGTVITSGQQITDSQQNKWTITSGVVLENGSAAGYSANVIALAYVNGAIYQENDTYGWWYWGNNTWNATSNPIGASPSDTTITGVAGQYIMDSQGNVWQLESGVVYENGALAGYSANVIELAYVSGNIYQENTANNWWVWAGGGTWNATSNPL